MKATANSNASESFYRAYDFTAPEDVVIADRSTYTQAVEATFRYLAQHPDSENVAIFRFVGPKNEITWTYYPDEPDHQNRVRLAAEAIANGVPEERSTGLP
jgi:hypothetical protein